MRHAHNPADEAAKAKDDPLKRASAGAEASGDALRWAPKQAPEAGLHGGASFDDANQQYVPMLDDDEQQCQDVLQQIAAIRGAVNGLMREVIKGHLLEHVVLEDDKVQREEDMEVVLKVLDSYIK